MTIHGSIAFSQYAYSGDPCVLAVRHEKVSPVGRYRYLVAG